MIINFWKSASFVPSSRLAITVVAITERVKKRYVARETEGVEVDMKKSKRKRTRQKSLAGKKNRTSDKVEIE
jgi:hypothetical protein